jgi:hypothetical protein
VLSNSLVRVTFAPEGSNVFFFFFAVLVNPTSPFVLVFPAGHFVSKRNRVASANSLPVINEKKGRPFSSLRRSSDGDGFHTTPHHMILAIRQVQAMSRTLLQDQSTPGSCRRRAHRHHVMEVSS